MSSVEGSSPSAPAREAVQARRLRVLFINDTSRNGGPGRTILYILKFLDPARIHRTVLIPREGIVSRRLADNRVAEALFFEPGLVENIYEPLSHPMERKDFDAPLVLLQRCACAATQRCDLNGSTGRGEAVDPVAVFRGDSDGRGHPLAKEPLQRFLFEAPGQVGFVQDRKHRFCGHFCEELPVVRRQIRAPVKEDEDGVGRLQPLPYEVDPLLFDGVFRRPEPGGVGQADRDPPEINGLLDEVTRRPRN